MIVLSEFDGFDGEGVNGECTRPARVSRKFETSARGDILVVAGAQVVSSRSSGVGGDTVGSVYAGADADISSSHLIEAIVGPEMCRETSESADVKRLRWLSSKWPSRALSVRKKPS